MPDFVTRFQRLIVNMKNLITSLVLRPIGLVTILLLSFMGCKSSSQGSADPNIETTLSNDKENTVSTEIVVNIGDKSKTFTLKDMQAMRKVSIADYEAIGGKKGHLGVNTWSGTSLKEMLLEVDPTLDDPKNVDKQIILTSIDDWFSVVKWPELFGEPRGGEVLYNIIGCNECHGINGEGTAPADHPPAPELLSQKYDHKDVMDILREGNEAHANINPFTPAQLSESELGEILYWLENPKAPVPAGAFTPDPSKREMILAYEMNGKNMTSEDGLIQLIVEMDEFSSRYSHWVSRIEVR